MYFAELTAFDFDLRMSNKKESKKLSFISFLFCLVMHTMQHNIKRIEPKLLIKL